MVAEKDHSPTILEPIDQIKSSQTASINPNQGPKIKPCIRSEKSKPLKPISKQSSPLSYVQVTIANNVVHAFLDTGASISLISESLYNDLPSLKHTHLSTVTSPCVHSVSGEPLDVLGSMIIPFNMSSVQLQHTFLVIRNINHAMILGWDFCIANNVTIDISSSSVLINNTSIPMLHKEQLIPIISNAVVSCTVTIPANSEKNILLKVFTDDQNLVSYDYTGILEPEINSNILVARTLSISNNGCIPVLVMNPTSDDISLYANTPVGQFHSVIGQKGELFELPLKEPESVNLINSKDQPAKLDKSAELEFDLSDSDLTSDQMKEVQGLLLEFSDVFSKHPNDYGRTDILQHNIDTGDSPPIRQRAYRVSPKLHNEFKKQVDDLLEQDLIEPSTSNYSAPALLVKKKTPGQWRMVCDYRKINLVSLTDCHPLPRIDDSIDALRGSGFFSTIDLAGAFWQVEMNPQSKHKTAFSTGDGLYQWKVMPMGLKNSSRTFQRLMELVFNGMHWTRVCVYIDDVVIFGKNFEDKMKNLKEVFERLRSSGLKARANKCKFFRKEITFLGHVVSKLGIKPDNSNIEKISNWPRPANVASVRSWLGLTGFYRKFIKDYAKISQPLLNLIKKDSVFNWTDECECAFQYLRQALIHPPILSYPDFDKAFVLYVDASSYAVGSVLSQTDNDNVEKVIAYASHSLTQSERKWSTYDRELYAIVWAIRHFKHYLQNCQFRIVSDHKPLVGLRKIPIDNDPTCRRARWALEIDVMDWVVEYKKGCNHTNADAMSRRENDQDIAPVSQSQSLGNTNSNNTCSSVTSSDQDTLNTTNASRNQSNNQNIQNDTFSLANDCDRLRELQDQDRCINKVLAWKRSGNPPPPLSRFRRGQPVLFKLRRIYKHLIVRSGILWKRQQTTKGKPRTLQAVVPTILIPEILSQIHGPPCVGHFGFDRTMDRASSFFWPFMQRDIRNFCRSCEACQKQQGPVPGHRAPLKPIFSSRPFEMVAADIAELGITSKGNRYILVVTDYFTKYINIYPLQRQTAEAVAECLFSHYIRQHSLMEKLHSDQGAQFEADVIQSLCKKFGVKKLHTSPGHPSSDGQCERMNRTIRSQLVRCLSTFPGEWDDLVPQLELAYNTSTHTSTGFSPFYLIHMREPRLPANVMFGPYDVSLDKPENTLSYASRLEKQLKAASQLVRNTNKEAHEKQKQHYDKRVRFKPYQINQLVYLTNPRSVRNKLANRWIGPYRVNQVYNDGLNYQIIDPMALSAKPKVVHYNRLKPHFSSDGRYGTNEPTTNRYMSQPRPNITPQETHKQDIGANTFPQRPIPSQVSRAHFRRIRDGINKAPSNVRPQNPPNIRPQNASPMHVSPNRRISSPTPESPRTPPPSAGRQAALQQAALQSAARSVGNEGRVFRGMPQNGQVSRFGRVIRAPKRLTY